MGAPGGEWILEVALAMLAVSSAGALYTFLLRAALRRRTAELRGALARLRDAVALKEEFLNKVTHELRTPLHGLMGVHEELLASGLSAAQLDQLKLARAAAERLDGLIGSLLDLSAAEAGELYVASEEFDPGRMMACVMSRFEAVAEAKGLQMVHQTGGLPARVVGDSRRIRQVLEILIDNAVRFTEKGQVEVRTSAGMASGGVVQLTFTVEDTGPGVSETLRPHLFEPFRQADGSLRRQHGGGGLGLAVASRVVAAMGGRLWLDSHPGQSARFCFTVKCGVAAARQAGRPLRVLLAEDNALNQLVARRPLEKAGHVVAVADNGRAAVARYELEDFDIVLMDVQMPVMDGLEAARVIRQQERRRGRRVPIAAVTAHSFSEDLQRYREAGIDDCLAKPFQSSDLLALVERLGANGACSGAAVVH
jgi:signal transduction histidine kinase/ActR/RegA family two-component response regulator